MLELFGGSPATSLLVQSALCKLFSTHLGFRKDADECTGIVVGLGEGDAEVHWICPQQIDDAIASGLTTMYGGGALLGSALDCSNKKAGCRKRCISSKDKSVRRQSSSRAILSTICIAGTGPATGTNATTCTPAPSQAGDGHGVVSTCNYVP